MNGMFFVDKWNTSPAVTWRALCCGEPGMNHPLQLMPTVSLTEPALLVSMTNMPVQSQFSHSSGATSGAARERAVAAPQEGLAEGT